jgi:hypothetical protein
MEILPEGYVWFSGHKLPLRFGDGKESVQERKRYGKIRNASTARKRGAA